MFEYTTKGFDIEIDDQQQIVVVLENANYLTHNIYTQNQYRICEWCIKWILWKNQKRHMNLHQFVQADSSLA